MMINKTKNKKHKYINPQTLHTKEEGEYIQSKEWLPVLQIILQHCREYSEEKRETVSPLSPGSFPCRCAGCAGW